MHRFPLYLPTIILTLTLLLSGIGSSIASTQIERVYLTHQSEDPSRIVINWETTKPTVSIVKYGTTENYDRQTKQADAVTRHHVEIAIPEKNVVWHYSVGDGQTFTPDSTFKGYPSKGLRIGIVGDWGFAKGKDLSALIKDDVHLLLTAGDNVPSLHEKNLEGTKAFAALIDQNAALFRSVPFMPILGNHDREIRPRGRKPPAEPVYDVEATAYREFFALPGDEWKWAFGLPDFDLKIFALDLNHIQDHGTTWQTCHPWDADSDQYKWYAEQISREKSSFILTLMNEKRTTVYGKTKGTWQEQFKKSSAVVTGFGYFAERALLDGLVPYFNTCLKGDGTVYKDPESKFLASEDNYLLLTIPDNTTPVSVALKNLRGETLEATKIARKAN